MFLYPTPTNNRQLATDIFHTLLMEAFIDSLLEKLSGRKNGLLSFPDKKEANMSNRRFMGMQEIPLEKVIGTLGRESDFDAKFRPVKKHLRDRWVNVFINLECDNGSPILVHKIGEVYYVEDGHHRTSVARSMGKAFIYADVWEYPMNPPRDNVCQPESCHSSPGYRPVEACAS